MEVAGGATAAAAAAAAAAGGAVAGARPVALAATAMVWSLLTADNASTAVSSVLFLARHLGASPPQALHPSPSVAAAAGVRAGTLRLFPPLLPLPAPLVALLPPAGNPPADQRLFTAALATLRTVAVVDAACAELMPAIPTAAALRTPPRSVTVTPAVDESLTMTITPAHTRSFRSHQCKHENAHKI